MIDGLALPEPYPASTDRDFDPILEQHIRSEQASRQAFSAASRGAWLGAARAFVDAALAVLIDPPAPTWDIAARNREVFYRNAATYYRRAAAAAEARGVLADLAARDPHQRAILQQLCAELDRP